MTVLVSHGHKETWRASTQNDVIYLIETIEQHREMRRQTNAIAA